MSGLNIMPGLKLSAALSIGIIAGSVLPLNRSHICIVIIALLIVLFLSFLIQQIKISFSLIKIRTKPDVSHPG